MISSLAPFKYRSEKKIPSYPLISYRMQIPDQENWSLFINNYQQLNNETVLKVRFRFKTRLSKPCFNFGRKRELATSAKQNKKEIKICRDFNRNRKIVNWTNSIERNKSRVQFTPQLTQMKSRKWPTYQDKQGREKKRKGRDTSTTRKRSSQFFF